MWFPFYLHCIMGKTDRACLRRCVLMVTACDMAVLLEFTLGSRGCRYAAHVFVDMASYSFEWTAVLAVSANK